MKVVALSVKGQEYSYNPNTAHKVSENSAEKIAEALNRFRYGMTKCQYGTSMGPDLVWSVHDVDTYDAAYYEADDQAFRIYRGTVKQCWKVHKYGSWKEYWTSRNVAVIS